MGAWGRWLWNSRAPRPSSGLWCFHFCSVHNTRTTARVPAQKSPGLPDRRKPALKISCCKIVRDKIEAAESSATKSSITKRWAQAMEIKDARLADLPAIVAIYNATVPTRMVTADTQPVSVESRIPWFEQHSSARRPLWVVIEAGQVMGWLSYSSFYGRPAYDGTCELGLYLAPQHQRRGLGSEVLRRAIEHAPTIGVRTLLGFI